MKPRLLVLFCGAGGSSMGYHRAGFETVGVDVKPQPRYPFEFVQADALSLVGVAPEHVGIDFDAIHASPPCHAYSTVSGQARKGQRRAYPDLVAPVRELLRATGLPYVIENVVNAPLVDPIQLCGSSFGLDVRRHRLFESNVRLVAPPCAHWWQLPRFRSLNSRQRVPASVVGVHGHLNYAGEQELRERAMEIDWMTPHELTQAIPPAYTEFLGRQLAGHLRAQRQHAEIEREAA